MAGASGSWGDDYTVDPVYPDQIVVPADPPTLDAVDRMRRAAAEFSMAYANFFSSRADAVAAGLGDEWAALNERATTAQGYISQVADAVSGAWGWAKSVFGLAGLRLGFLPALPIAYAVLAAAIAWVVSVTADLIKFNQKLNAVKAGTAPQSVLTSDSSITGDMTSLIKWGIVGVLAITVLPRVLDSVDRHG